MAIWLIFGGGLVLAFGLGYFWRAKTSRVKWLVEQANLKTQQIQTLEKINKEQEDKNRELYAKEQELVIANQHLQTLEEAKSKFISVTTHQLRTPLAAIKWTLDMVIKGQLGDDKEEQKKFFTQSLISVNRVISIVNDLLKVDSIDTEQLEYHFKPADLLKLLNEILFEFNNQLLAKKINLVLTKPENVVPSIEMDSEKIRIVLENLIDNAIKYTSEGGQVEVKISDERLNSAENAIIVSIGDSGIGIPSTDTDHVFQKFFRGSNAIQKEPDGSGLGLFIAHDIIEKHNGAIWFQTRFGQGGQGTIFSFTLPLHHKKV